MAEITRTQENSRELADRTLTDQTLADQAQIDPANEERWRALLDSSLDCIIWTDEQGRIEEFNSSAERTFRASRAAVLGKDLSSTILPAALRCHLRGELFASVVKSGVDPAGNPLETKAMRSD